MEMLSGNSERRPVKRPSGANGGLRDGKVVAMLGSMTEHHRLGIDSKLPCYILVLKTEAAVLFCFLLLF